MKVTSRLGPGVNVMAALLVLGILGAAVAMIDPAGRVASKRLRLADAAPSMAELLDRFVRALESGDRLALERLRVSEAEYRGIIIPGSVPPGSPPQQLTEQASEYFWGVLDTKSRYYAAALAHDRGGHRYKIRDFPFQKGTNRRDWFTEHRRLEIMLEDEIGREVSIATGSIVEVNGEFKFASFIRD